MKSEFRRAALVVALTSIAFPGSIELDAAPRSKLKSTVPLDELIEYNAQALFGDGEVKITGDTVEILLHKDGHLLSAFTGRGLMDSQHETMTGSNRKFIQYGDQKDGEKLLPGLAAIGLGKGLWTSRFELAGKTRISFKIRLPNILTRQSDLRLRINAKRGRGYETSFFNTIAAVSGGRAKTPIRSRLKGFEGTANRWFPRKGEPVSVEMVIDDEGCRVVFEGKETVRYPKVSDEGGAIAFSFNRLVFTLQDVRISGLIDRDWCLDELVKLEKRGELLETLPVKEPTPDLPPIPDAGDDPEAGEDH